MKFSDIPGHEEAKRSLRAMAESGRVAHAVMLSGRSGIGKMELARAFAQYLHCASPENGEPCGRCSACLQHQSFNSPDLHFVYPVKKIKGKGLSSMFSEQWKEMLTDWPLMPLERWLEIIEAGNVQPQIYVEESQEIIDTAYLSPYREKLKIFIIWLPELFRAETANKLLKIIEEPFPDTVFILVSNDDSQVLPTIASRTRRINLRPLDSDVLATHLMGKGVSRAMAEEVARLSEGSLSRAEQIALAPDELREFGEAFRGVMRSSYGARMTQLKTLCENTAGYGRRKLMRFLDYCADMMRENFIYNLRMPEINLLTEEERAFSSRFAPFIHEQNVEELCEEISRARTDIERNGNAKIVMFDLGLMFATLLRRPKNKT